MTAIRDPGPLLAAVLERPFDDAPRLVFADWLEEHGETARAEFIRVQRELASDASPVGVKARPATLFGESREFHKRGRRSAWGKRQERLERRSRGLLSQHRTRWLLEVTRQVHPDAPGSAAALAAGVEFRRGFVESARLPLAALVGRECDRCLGAGDHGPMTDSRAGLNADLRVECAVCKGTGTLPGVAGRLAAACPVTEVVVTDREPANADHYVHRNTEGKVNLDWVYWLHVRDDREHFDTASMRHWLPDKLAQALQGGIRFQNGLYYPGRDAALLALSRAAVQLARSLAPGFTHQGPCGNGCWPLSGVYVVSDDGRQNSTAPSKRCPSCFGTGAATRPGLPPLDFQE